MNGLNLMNAPCCYLEIGLTSLHALSGDASLEMPLERQPNGRLTAACKEALTLKLPGFFKHEAWQPRPRLLCAIGARGVSLRRFTLPAVAKDELPRLLRLQIEKEFPLSPDEMAWGYQPLGEPTLPRNGNPAQQEFLVAAVRKEVVEEYSELLSACAVTPQFTLAALARSYVCPHPPAAFAVLDIAGHQSELMSFENGVPVAVRLVSWGGEDIAQALAERLGVTREEAEKLKAKLEQTPVAAHEAQPQVQDALENALSGLARSLDGQWTPGKLYLSGKSARNKELAARLTRFLPHGTVCEIIEPSPPGARSAAVLGLKAAAENRALTPPVFLQVKPTNGAVSVARITPWKWVRLAALLLVAIVALPYLEALLLKPHLTKQLAALKADRGRLPMIDRELEFLQFLKQNEPPYLDTLYILSKSAPQGAKIDSLSMTRRGELSLRGTMKDVTQVAEFRKKLIDSGLFASVSLEEQTPSPDRQKLSVRMTGQWKALAARRTLALGPTAEEIEKAKTRDRSPQGMPPMMGMPNMGGMPGPSMSGMPGGPGGSSLRMSSSRRSSSGGSPDRGPMPGGSSSSGPPPDVSSRYGSRPNGSPSPTPSSHP
jgi:hypothetical protein